MSQGWFKIHRELFEKSIWLNSTPEQKVILITLLGMANHQGKEWEWKGKQFKAAPGQFVTSIDSIIKKAGKDISEKNVRTALNKFEKYGFLANESTKTGRLITIVNWGLYQASESEDGKEEGGQVADDWQTGGKDMADRWQTGGRQVAPNKNDKKDKKVENVEKEENVEEKEPPQPPSIPPNLSDIEKIIIDQFGEITYGTWFSRCEVKEDDKQVTFISPDSFITEVIATRYREALQKLSGKSIYVHGKDFKGDESQQ